MQLRDSLTCIMAVLHPEMLSQLSSCWMVSLLTSVLQTRSMLMRPCLLLQGLVVTLLQVDSSKDASSSNTGSNASGAGGISRFRRFGFGSQLLQKTVGLVLKPRQAKLGDSNKFYYDEKLKRWVEEGAELPAAEPPLAPPPTAPAFQNGAPDYNVKSVLKRESPICNNGFLEMKSPTSDIWNSTSSTYLQPILCSWSYGCSFKVC